MPNRLFGDAWIGTPAGIDAEFIDTPVGATCPPCGEPIEADDSGIEMGHLATTGVEVHYWHRGCHLLGILGHTFEVCRCTGWGKTKAAGEELVRRMEVKATTRIIPLPRDTTHVEG